jgi:hypothetical protein
VSLTSPPLSTEISSEIHQEPKSHSQIAAEGEKKIFHHVVVYSAFPKSGSQSTLEMIRQTMGRGTSIYIPKSHSGFGHNVISPGKLPKFRRFFSPCLIYGHITPTGYNIAQLEKVSSSPWFVSIRGLKDVVVSYKEHVDQTGIGPLDYRLPGLSEGLVDWNGMRDELKYSFIIRYIMPWYVRFVAGWQFVGKTRRVRFIRFEEVVDSPVETLEKIASDLQMDSGRDFHGQTMPHVNFNLGEKNRGNSKLNSEHCLELARLLEFYPEIRDLELGEYLMQKS